MAVMTTMTAPSRSATSVMPKGACQFDIWAATTPSSSTSAIRTTLASKSATVPATEIQRPAGDLRNR